METVQRPARRLRKDGDPSCPHLWFVKAKNSYGFNFECRTCTRQWYQPWSPEEQATPIPLRRCSMTISVDLDVM